MFVQALRNLKHYKASWENNELSYTVTRKSIAIKIERFKCKRKKVSPVLVGKILIIIWSEHVSALKIQYKENKSENRKKNNKRFIEMKSSNMNTMENLIVMHNCR
jgi:ribosomal protein L10